MKTIEEYFSSLDATQIMPGAEPFFFKKGKVGCLLLHGWGGTCDSMRYLGRKLHDAGITVYTPLLPGHGTSPVDMARYTAKDWVGAAVEHVQIFSEVCSPFFVSGLSMRGLITLYLGATQFERIRGIASINAPIVLNNPEFASLALEAKAPQMMPQWLQGLLKDPRVKEISYDQVPTSGVLSLLGLAKVVEELLPTVTIPILILQSRDDGVVPPQNAKAIFKKIGPNSKHLQWLKNSYHVATLDFDKDAVASAILQFINRNC